MKYIEAVCTGNNGRSPMLEAVGNREVARLGIEEKIGFISSGTEAAPEFDLKWNYRKAEMMITKASRSGLVKPLELDPERYNADPEYAAAVNSRALKAVQIMRSIETALREAALYDAEITNQSGRKQTVPRDDVSLVLGFTSKHLAQAETIYSTGGFKPEIAQVHLYARTTDEPKDGLGSLDVQIYIRMRRQLEEIVPKVLERFRDEHHV